MHDRCLHFLGLFGGFAGSDKDPKLHSVDENLVTEVRAKSSDLPKKIPIPE
jgi:hypothetical protein